MLDDGPTARGDGDAWLGHRHDALPVTPAPYMVKSYLRYSEGACLGIVC
eukprot:COSAG05_NODE_24258_length_252_cov_2.000000_1_plen_48_part_10